MSGTLAFERGVRGLITILGDMAQCVDVRLSQIHIAELSFSMT